MDNNKTLNERIVEIIEEFDLDFNVGNAVLSLLSVAYSDDPITLLEHVKFLLDKRTQMLNNQINKNSYVKRIWRTDV